MATAIVHRRPQRRRRDHLACRSARRSRGRRSAAHSGLRGGADPGTDRRSRRSDAARQDTHRADLSRFPVGDSGHQGFPPARRSARSGCRRRSAVELAAPALHRDGRRKQVDRQARRAFTSSSRQAACAMPAASAIISSAGYGASEATVLLVGFQAHGTLGRFLHDGVKAVRIQGDEIKVAARIRIWMSIPATPTVPELARWIAARRPIRARRISGAWRGACPRRDLQTASPNGSSRPLRLFRPILDDIYELSTTATPTLVDVTHRRRLAPEAVDAARLAQ